MVSILVAVRKVGIDFPNFGLYAIEWLTLGSNVIQKIRKSQVLAEYAGEMETAVSLVIQPENVQLDEAVKELPGIPLSSKWWSIYPPPTRRLIHLPRKFPKMGLNAGVMGDPTVATKESGEKIMAAAVDDLVELLLEIVKAEGEVKGY